MTITRYTQRYAPDFVREGGAPSPSDVERLLAVAGGAALTYFGWRWRGPLGFGLMAFGGALIAHGATGYPEPGRLAPERLRETAAERLRSRPVTATRSVTIARPREEVYRFWRDFTNLPRFMAHLERVDVITPARSRWVVRGPLGRAVEWEAEVEDERPNEWIAWRSLPGADVPNSGLVTFRDGPGGHGTTEMHVTMSYELPAGPFGRALARLFGEEPGQQMRENLERLRRLLETGQATGPAHG